jgi:hypothetical protein
MFNSLSYWQPTNKILHTIHRPVFYLKHNVSETGLSPVRETETSSTGSDWVGSTLRRRQNEVSERRVLNKRQDDG